jgi:hypothetical protein
MRPALVLGALVHAPAQVSHAAGQPIAQQLQLLQAEQAGTGPALVCGAGSDAEGAHTLA